MIWAPLEQYNDSIQWLQINLVTLFCHKENAYFNAVAENVKHWESKMHWTTICVEHNSDWKSLALLVHDPPLSKETLLMQHTSRTSESELKPITTIYHFNYEKYIQATFDMLMQGTNS